MTVLAQLDPGLKQFFDRIDSAPSPRDEVLATLLDVWKDKRADLIAPPVAALEPAAQASPQAAFIFRRAKTAERDYVLHAGADAVRPLIGEEGDTRLLSDAAFPRGSVRLRMLFEFVCRTGEPISATFTTHAADGGRIVAELVVTPLSGDGRSIDAVFGGVLLRPVAAAASGPAKSAAATAPLIFSFARDVEFGGKVARAMGLELSLLEEREFEDGEHKARPLESVRGRDAFVIASLNGGGGHSANDRLCRLLFFIATLKTNGAKSVTAVTPYLCYLRKDRQTKPRDPLTGRYVAELIEAMGADRVITIEAHNVAAYQSSFRIPTLHLEAYDVFARRTAEKVGTTEVTVVSPDLGGGKRADSFRERLEKQLGRPVGKAFMEKQRSAGVVSGDLFAGDVKDRVAIIIDDLISSGGTMVRVAEACMARGAKEVRLIATHALFSQGAEERLARAPIAELLITDTVQVDAAASPLGERLATVSVAETFAAAITRCHQVPSGN
ncbi:ribose-phosphate diphosphokinase [Ciceribacter thiooxidans]|uniref:Ribose-phosphate diphosphokinase n=1 Tax=Ciceribacter thiooxidans TaxID=1969821 RepID=A0ABV7HZZ3_9HYPH|nr:ribose-phosphate diphosphokinase [Ciceribacter thiooxidans]